MRGAVMDLLTELLVDRVLDIVRARVRGTASELTTPRSAWRKPVVRPCRSRFETRTLLWW